MADKAVGKSVLQAIAGIWGDGRATLLAIGLSMTAYSIAALTDRKPELLEVGWLLLTMVGFLYHVTSRAELVKDRSVLTSYPPLDPIDLESVNNDIRRETLRSIGKVLGMLAGLVSLYLPPRVNPAQDIAVQGIALLLVLWVTCLDADAVLERASRRRRIVILEERRTRKLLDTIAARQAHVTTAARDAADVVRETENAALRQEISDMRSEGS